MPAAGPSLAQLGHQLVNAARADAAVEVGELVEAITNRRHPPTQA